MASSGFNTDVSCDGTLYHVQSEDRGEAAPLLETLVYCGGRILHQERRTLSDLADGERGADALMKSLERQHRDIVRRARHGEFAAGDRATRRALVPEDEPLSDRLARWALEAGLAPLALSFAPREAAGGLFGRLVVRSPDSGAPAAGVRVAARLVSRELPPARIWTGETGPDGAVTVSAALPLGAPGAVIFLVEGGAGRLRVDVDEAGRPAL